MKIRNTEQIEVGDIQGEMLERRPLPMGRQEFMDWSDRIIKSAMIPGATYESLRWALASMIMSLGPTEAFREDGYFILCLRKASVNQVAHSVLMEIKEAQEKRKQAEATAPNLTVVADGVLENQTIPDPA